jgi:hypothetical protein
LGRGQAAIERARKGVEDVQGLRFDKRAKVGNN